MEAKSSGASTTAHLKDGSLQLVDEHEALRQAALGQLHQHLQQVWDACADTDYAWQACSGQLLRVAAIEGNKPQVPAQASHSLRGQVAVCGAPSPVMAEVGTMLAYVRASGFFQYSSVFSPCNGISASVRMHVLPASVNYRLGLRLMQRW
jgi:hypothetical protein